jgi:hypothetical protein
MACSEPAKGDLRASFELGVLSPEEKRQFEAHLLECDHCFEDLYRSAPVAELVRDKKLAPEGETTEEVSSPTGRGIRSWALAVATVVVLVAAFLVFQPLGPPEETERLRGTESGAIVVFAPIGDVPLPTELDWKMVPGAVAYDLRIQTSSGIVVWEGTAEEPPAVLPDAVREELEPGRTYFWAVEARSESGTSWSSEPTRFSIWR